MKKTPKYAQIEAELIAQIESGQLAPGAELPSESDLIECYGVSRGNLNMILLLQNLIQGILFKIICFNLSE